MSDIVSKFVSMWLHPWGSMSQVKQEGDAGSLKSSFVFILVMGLISGVITSVTGLLLPAAPLPGPKAMIWLSVVIVPVVSFIGSFVGAFIIWGLIDGFLRGTASQYKISYRLLAFLAAFSPVSALLSPIPKVGQYLAIAVNLWATIIMIRGIIIVRDTPPVRTWVICGILFALLFSIGVFARLAAQRQFQAGAPGFSDFAGEEDFGDEGLTGTDDLDKQLESLAEKAKAEEPKK